MMYVKATAVGIVTGLVLAIAWVAAALWVPLYWQMLLSQLRNEGGGVGASSVAGGSALLAALVGFAVGFFWTVRRSRRRHLAT